MTTLAAGTSTTISLAVGQSLFFSPGGSGLAVLSGGQKAGEPYKIGPSPVEIGPFSQVQAVSVSAVAPVGYFILPIDAANDLPAWPVTVDAAGNVSDPRIQAAVSGGGTLYGNVQNFLPMVLSAWDDSTGTGATFAIDNAVLFDGKPTMRVTIPAGQTACRFGTLDATAIMPYNWDKSRFAVAIMCSNIAVMASPALYIADKATGYGNNVLTWGQLPVSQSQDTRNNEWLVYQPEKDTTNSVGWTTTGTYTAAATKMLRMNLSLTGAQATDTTFWVGCFGVMQSRPKPTLIPIYDDGRESIYTHVYPLFKALRMPLSIAVVSSIIGTPTYMTWAQLREIANDPSGLFEVVIHSRSHINRTTMGNAAYVQDVIGCRADLIAQGFTGDGLNHHAFVESDWSSAAIDGLRAAGFRNTRTAGFAFERVFEDGLYRSGDKKRWLMNALTTLGNGTTATASIVEVDAWRAFGGYVTINGHDFKATSTDAYTFAFKEHAQLMGYVASLRDAGSIELMRWSQWFNTYCV